MPNIPMSTITKTTLMRINNHDDMKRSVIQPDRSGHDHDTLRRNDVAMLFMCLCQPVH